MIVFDLKCEASHVFEAWFKNSDVYTAQASEGLIECPFCGSRDISKSLMSPNLAPTGDHSEPKRRDSVASDLMLAASANVPDSMEASAEDVKRALEHMHQTLKNYRNQVKKECEYVGENFAKEARAIHEGDAQTRGIYGEATLKETEELLNDGIDILPVPGLGKLDS